ncbi:MULTISPECIES: hypothetical protein [unclassified Gemella]|uniref:hypothetical protein n=1 Tax=unclassified Gemella TaxID=2624949 RepID=UPI001073295A|nr:MULTISPECIES: hypothetical protein [unclassified Gemella]MBF0709734.1 hypothetical protein [Gemella sp. GL1.1]MBF0747251.1 hypothetical protein [Gemella sp. 19428wG2_WT2a]NYS27078.1 hypothetical protein [Gemella sp. GL1]TFU57837.1 hypothetical protein E4T67_06230 [Gemella sp. WT2a]
MKNINLNIKPRYPETVTKDSSILSEGYSVKIGGVDMEDVEKVKSIKLEMIAGKRPKLTIEMYPRQIDIDSIVSSLDIIEVNE